MFTYVIIWLGSLLQLFAQPSVFGFSSGTIRFVSVAPLETISASTNEIKGLLNTSDNTFAFSVSNKSFTGFNSALQQEHFNENYMESDKYPFSTFSGKIIESVDLTKPGNYEVRAKGVLDIHGIKHDRIIRCKVQVDNNQVSIKSQFIVLLEDHKIAIPRIVNQKLFPEINVSVDLTLKPK